MAVAAGAGLLAALIGLLWIIRAKQLRLHFNRRARGLRYFRLAADTAAAGAQLDGQPAGAAGDGDGAVRAPGRDDAVGR
jgi:hypothetical protein